MRPFETMENKIVIVILPIGLIIGKMAEGIMINPRVLIVGESEGKVTVRFKHMFGDPEMFFMSYTPYYISENAELNELYEGQIAPVNNIITP